MKLSSLQKGLVGHWTLDQESLKSSLILGDKTPHSNDGVSVNTPVFAADRMGQANRAMVFDHTNNDVVVIQDNPILRPGTDDFTISFWIKGPLSGSLSWDGVITKGLNTSANAHTWGFLRSGTSTNSIRYHQASDAGGAWDVSIDIVLLDGWNHVVVRRIGSTVQIFINNTYYNQNTSAGSDLSTSYNIFIGRDRSSRYSSCSIYDIRQYNRGTSDEEITALFEMYRPKLSMGSLMKGFQ